MVLAAPKHNPCRQPVTDSRRQAHPLAPRISADDQLEATNANQCSSLSLGRKLQWGALKAGNTISRHNSGSGFEKQDCPAKNRTVGRCVKWKSNIVIQSWGMLELGFQFGELHVTSTI